MSSEQKTPRQLIREALAEAVDVYNPNYVLNSAELETIGDELLAALLPAVAAAGEAVACDRCKNLTNALGFFASVIKSGEAWSVECENMLRAAYAHAHPSAGAGDAPVLEAADALFEWYTSHGGNAPIGSYLQRLYRAAEKRRAALTRHTGEGREELARQQFTEVVERSADDIAELRAQLAAAERARDIATQREEHFHTVNAELTENLKAAERERDKSASDALGYALQSGKRWERAKLMERDARRWQALRGQLTIALGSMDRDGGGPFRHFLQFLHNGRKFIPGSGNDEVPVITDALLDAAADAVAGDVNAYCIAMGPAITEAAQEGDDA